MTTGKFIPVAAVIFAFVLVTSGCQAVEELPVALEAPSAGAPILEAVVSQHPQTPCPLQIPQRRHPATSVCVPRLPLSE